MQALGCGLPILRPPSPPSPLISRASAPCMYTGVNHPALRGTLHGVLVSTFAAPAFRYCPPRASSSHGVVCSFLTIFMSIIDTKSSTITRTELKRLTPAEGRKRWRFVTMYSVCPSCINLAPPGRMRILGAFATRMKMHQPRVSEVQAHRVMHYTPVNSIYNYSEQ